MNSDEATGRARGAKSASLWRGEAPGRLDVLGGVAKYSGALVLQTPTRATTRVEIAPHRAGDTFACASERERTPFVATTVALRALFARHMRSWGTDLEALGAPSWTHSVLGCFGSFTRETGWWPETALRFRVSSDVPPSVGAGSGVSLQAATMRALQSVSNRVLGSAVLARLAQEIDREVVGGPNVLKDHLVCLLGQLGSLLPVLCRPGEVGELVPLPPGVIVAAWPSGVRPDVGATPLATARAAMFMGKKIVESTLGPHSFLSEIASSRLPELPIAIRGEEFWSSYGAPDEAHSGLEAERVYPVGACARFAVEEHFRCQVALRLLQSDRAHQSLPLIGELMWRSNAAYGAMGLGHPQTDAMIEALRARGPEHGFYGARVSNHGAGAAVVVLLEERALGELAAMRAHVPGSGALIL